MSTRLFFLLSLVDLQLLLFLLLVHGQQTELAPRHVTIRQSNETVEKFVTRMFQDYERTYRPAGEEMNSTEERDHAPPVKVKINVFIVSFSGINVLSMDYVVDLLLRQRWYDYRLMYSGFNEVISLSYMKEKLWIPDLFFRNGKEGHLHTLTTPNNLIWLNQSGHILFSQKLSVKLTCPMQLWHFPMDTQTCRMEMGSYGYAKRDLLFEWLDPHNASINVAINPDLELNEFHRPSVYTASCERVYTSTGEFPCIIAVFRLHRKFAYYLIYTYLPSILIVIISWVSFFIDYKAVPARISLGLLSVLSLITQTAATLQQLPRVSYVKALDIWLFISLAFVVISLIEFAVVNVLARRHERREANRKLQAMMQQELKSVFKSHMFKLPMSMATTSLREGSESTENQHPSASSTSAVASECVVQRRSLLGDKKNLMEVETTKEDGRVSVKDIEAQHLDQICVFAFPLLFILFNIVYWMYFLMSSHKDPSLVSYTGTTV